MHNEALEPRAWNVVGVDERLNEIIVSWSRPFHVLNYRDRA